MESVKLSRDGAVGSHSQYIDIWSVSCKFYCGPCCILSIIKRYLG